MRFALEIFEHALESYVSEKPRDRKIAVLNLAQVLELAIKAVLVEKNIAIYEKDGVRTINTHNAVAALAKLWGVDRIPDQTRLELLIDERNAIQHRYGSVDDVTMDYHMQTAFEVLSEILERQFDADLQEWVRSNVDGELWQRVRFVEATAEQTALPSTAILDNRSATLDLVDGFAKYERAVRDAAKNVGMDASGLRSTLDVVMKMVVNLPPPVNENLAHAVPVAYRLRNQVIHGHREATPEEVSESLKTLDFVVNALRDSQNAGLLGRAFSASVMGQRGTRLRVNDVNALELTAGNPTTMVQQGDSPSEYASSEPVEG
jgi:uncharacterized protein YutE (UPF0331/DUF86 family)